MSRYDVSKFSPPPDQELVCGICMHVLDMPKESPCRHVFCKVCIKQALQEKSKCPLCRASLKVSQLKDVLPLVQNMLNKLTMHCDNYDNGCKELIPMERFIDHVTCCNYVMVTCKFSNCGQSILKLNQTYHETEECAYRDITCLQGCGLSFPWKDKESHNCVNSLLALKDDLIVKNKGLESKIDDLSGVISALNNKLQEYEGKKTKSKAKKSDSDADLSHHSYSDVASPTLSLSSINSNYYDDYYYHTEEEDPVSPYSEDFVSEGHFASGQEETEHAEFDPRNAATDIDENHAREEDWISNYDLHTPMIPDVESEELFLLHPEMATSEQAETYGTSQVDHSVETSITVSLFGQSGGHEEGENGSNSRKRLHRNYTAGSNQNKRPRVELGGGSYEIASESAVRRSRRLQNREPSPTNSIPYVDVPPTVSYLLDTYADDESSSDGSWSPSQ